MHKSLRHIFSLQQTSKKFRESINVPVVWRTLPKTYSARHFHIYQPQSRRFDDLTGHGSPEWVRKRLAFDRRWKAQTLQPRVRTLPPQDNNFTLKLVPGGRWLLVGDREGSVWYYDLDSEELERRILIQPSEDIEGSRQNGCGFETYLDTSGLYFNLAVQTTVNDVEWLQVWQVEIKDGNHLTAKWQASVPTPFDAYVPASLAIGRHVIAHTRYQQGEPDLQVVEIYWWKQCSPTRLLRSHFIGPVDCDMIYLIGDGRILCGDDQGGVSLYDIPEPEHISIEYNLELHEDIPSPKPIWSYKYSKPGWVYYSPLYHDGTTYRFVASTREEGIWGFTIPATAGHTPSVIQLAKTSGAGIIPGLYKAFAVDKVDLNGIRIGYSWESGDDGGAAMAYSRGELKGTPLNNTLQSVLDEESGRFVYPQVWGSDQIRYQVVILDFLDTEY